jgi:hypothetical protein
MIRRFAEFPNDNPELHEGALWTCPEVCGAPRALRIPRLFAENGLLIVPPSAELGPVASLELPH